MERQETHKMYPKMATFYSGKTVALTGGTGFLGQGIIEKLLRCCPEIKKIIIFIREKRNKTPEERLQDLAKMQVFDVIRNSMPNFSDKLHAVTCNLYKENLGLSQEDRKTLRNEVNIFIHCAATLKFNEHLREAFDINVQCPRRILRLCKTMRKLQAMVHISTAYTNCDHTIIEERIYDQRIHYKDMEASLRWMSDEAITRMTPDILEKKPNTYALTKAWAEDAVVEERGNVPVCILRPSMIVAALNEPMPGWCSNVYGPTAFVCSYSKGINHAVIGDTNMIADLVPVDFVVNGTLLSAMKTAIDFAARRDSIEWDSDSGNSTDVGSEDEIRLSKSHGDVEIISQQCSNDSGVPVYVINTSTSNPLVYRIIEIGIQGFNYDVPSMPLLPVFHLLSTRNTTLHKILAYITQTIPAIGLDVLLKLSGSRLSVSRLNQKIISGQEVMAFFFLNNLQIESKNTQFSLKNGINNEDLKTFSVDTRTFNWLEFMKVYLQGIQKFILKENTQDYTKAKRRYNRLTTLTTLSSAACKVGFDFLLENIGIQTPLWHSNSYNFDGYRTVSTSVIMNEKVKRHMATKQRGSL